MVPTIPPLRQDRWWIQPVLTVAVLTAFIIYSTWAAFQNKYYFVGAQHASRPHQPLLLAVHRRPPACPGAKVRLHLEPWTISPALLILIFPLGFRLTCYYYRRSYYRAFWWSPPACAVADAHGNYSGETRFPLFMQNAHRYFFYAGLVFNGLLTYRRGRSPSTSRASAGASPSAPSCSCVNAVCSGCTRSSATPVATSCGGQVQSFKAHPMRYRFWKFVTPLNAKHMNFAWASLLFVGLTDIYVRLVASGAITDYRLF